MNMKELLKDEIKEKRFPIDIRENDNFQVISYKLVIRQIVDIENGHEPKDDVEAQSYTKTQHKIERIVEEDAEYDADFFPIYIMDYTTPAFGNEHNVFYYGKTNSSSKRFLKHDALDEFKTPLSGRQNRKLYMCQVFVSFCLNREVKYNDIPLEWIRFEVDNCEQLRKSKLLKLKSLKKDQWISFHAEIDKIILFVENSLISLLTNRNKTIYFPRSLYQIYTSDISIWYDDGAQFIANASPRTPVDLPKNTNEILHGGFEDSVDENGKFCGDTSAFEMNDSEPTFIKFSVPDFAGCSYSLTKDQTYEYWKEKHNNTPDCNEYWLVDEND